MDPNEEGDSIFPRKSPVFDKGKAPNGSFSSAKSESEIELLPSFSQPSMGSNPFSPRESFFEDTTAGLSRVSIGFSAPLSSSEPVFSFKLEPSAEVDLDPMVEIDLPQPLECLQGQLVPPFLWKTFDIVEDPALDPIVSWGSTGQSFVVWDPVEFSRVILPSNFKHNNFSSFIRQLNTYVGIAVRQPLQAAVLYTKKYSHLPVTFVKGIENFHLHQGFHKIDTDKWEFANEAFQRGKRQLLKNIQRRKSPHSQPVGSFIGSSTEEGKLGIEDEIGRLKKERSMLMKEVVELQHQHKGTAQHMDIVSRRLQSAEQRQKRMISFLAKFLQNPAFLARLQKKKEQKAIGSPRVKRKFVKQHPNEMDEFKQFTEGQIVKYQPDWKKFTISSTAPDLNPDMLEDSTYLLQGMSRELGSIKESMSFQLEKASTGDVIVSEELALHHGTTKTAEDLRVEASNMTNEDRFFKGKSIDSTPQEFHPNYFISLTEDFPHFSPSGIGSVELDTIWSADMNFDAGMSSSSNELWNNQVDYEDPLLQVTSGLPPFWDLGSLQAGGSGTDKWSADEFPFDEPDSRAYPSKDDDSKNTKS